MKIRLAAAAQAIVALGLLATPLPVYAQPAKAYRIGVLSHVTTAARWRDGPPSQAFLNNLRRLGYQEGRNLVLEVRSAEGQSERLPGLAAELVRLPPDVILVGVCGVLLDAVRQATRTIPIVVQTCQADMAEAGIVQSLAHPGGNVTGISKMNPNIAAKRLQLLKETVPSLARATVLWDPAYADWSADWRELRTAAQQLRVTLESVEMRGAGDLDRALAAIPATRPDAVLSFSDVTTYVASRRVGEFAARHRLVWMSPFQEITAAGGPPLLRAEHRGSVRPLCHVRREDPGRREASGHPRGAADGVELIVNLRTAKALGLAIPPALVLRADQVIE
jgi:putative ABC transport system substrate-binding protein